MTRRKERRGRKKKLKNETKNEIARGRIVAHLGPIPTFPADFRLRHPIPIKTERFHFRGSSDIPAKW